MKYLLILILFTIAFWNAFVILWGTESESIKKRLYSKIWHGIGLALRIMIFALPFFFLQNWIEILKWTLIFVAVGGVLYDFIINFIRFRYNGAPPLWYVDNKGWNAFFLKFISAKWYWILRGIFVIGTIIYFLL